MNQLSWPSLRNRKNSIVPPSLSTVVVTHGWASKRLDMWLFCRRLRRIGYQVVNWSYPSLKGSIDDHGNSLTLFVNELESTTNRPNIHLVGHSMGGIVIRRALLNTVPEKLSRVVLLASPNGGSFVARKAAPWLGWFSSTLAELSDDEDSYVNQLDGFSDLEVGVVAANRDRVIEEERAHVAGETDFVSINSGHGIMPWKKNAVMMTHRFLMFGQFDRLSSLKSTRD